MSKKNFVTLVLSTVGGVLFALGMCMALLPEWGAMLPGVVLGAVGMVVLLCMVAVRRKMSGKPVFVPVSGKTVGTVAVGVVGALLLGVGMCLVMVWDSLALGIVIGLVGILVLLALIPLVKGLH